MSVRLMVLPGEDPANSRLLRIPEDMREQEAYRHVTGVIAAVQERNANCGWDEVMDALEEHGFEEEAFVLGPTLVCGH
ncbi:MAG: hypothetical protein B0D96_05215 [Candidatus Sedimenticola endophacoides]|nr:MAG: hypothetical protein B0D94_03900 [Candidatus Sedimenticola endophacoides]OQX36060.1 MAG: hypothetical protein B0D96_05215 [Candidatus Sedimenticola endophacoides]OQX39852.1 MAG: hypothetical protein B0D88_09100 [Candidatus Sedimenticola endophacoides]OQX40086.1 MAG: hypothetical protein B0D89_09045 [Candidatus Sedimenticola endophacoides]OQX48162.1 MAG: hypothetical protein B0D87_07155 [Candidatus Sedimenticola endophacoides]